MPLIRDIVGHLLILLAVLLLIAPVVVAIFTDAKTIGDSHAFEFWFLAGLFMMLGRRLTSETAEELLEEDQREPVLYLRPFRRDKADKIRHLIALITRNKDIGGKSMEEELVEELSDIGPVIALGKPGEILPPIGAARLYPSEGQDWKEEVRKLMGQAQLVVIRGSGTPGLLWEIQEAIRALDPSKVRFVFDNRYDHRRFYEWAWPVLPREFPQEYIGPSLRFSHDWSILRDDGAKSEDVLQKLRNDQSTDDARTARRKLVELFAPYTIMAVGAADLSLEVIFGVLVTSHGRAQIPGWLFGCVSVILVLIVTYIQTLYVLGFMDKIAPGVVRAGEFLKMSIPLMLKAMRLARSCTYTVGAHVRPLIAKAVRIERDILKRKQGAGDSATRSLEQIRDPLTDESILDFLQEDAFSFRAALTALGRAAMIAIRISSISFFAIASVALAITGGQIESWWLLAAAGLLGLLTGLVIARWLGSGHFVLLLKHPIYEEANDKERAFLEYLSEKPVHVKSHAEPRFYGLISRRIIKAILPTFGLHLLFLPLIFGAAAATTWIWPGSADCWPDYYLRSLLIAAIGCLLYTLFAWFAATFAGHIWRGTSEKFRQTN